MRWLGYFLQKSVFILWGKNTYLYFTFSQCVGCLFRYFYFLPHTLHGNVGAKNNRMTKKKNSGQLLEQTFPDTPWIKKSLLIISSCLGSGLVCPATSWRPTGWGVWISLSRVFAWRFAGFISDLSQYYAKSSAPSWLLGQRQPSPYSLTSHLWPTDLKPQINPIFPISLMLLFEF